MLVLVCFLVKLLIFERTHRSQKSVPKRVEPTENELVLQRALVGSVEEGFRKAKYSNHKNDSEVPHLVRDIKNHPL